MKTLVVGSGGLGGYYGALLCEAGKNPSFLVREVSRESLKSSGLTVDFPDRHLVVKPKVIESTVSQLEAPELVILTPKLYDLASVCYSLEPICGKKTVLITLQNGIDALEIVKRALPECIVVPACTYVIARRNTPGVITFSKSDPTIIMGPLREEDTKVVTEVCTYLTSAGIPIRNSPHIMQDIWVKFIYFAAYAGVSGSERVALGEIASKDEYQKLFYSAIDEGIRVAQYLGVPFLRD